MAAAVRAITSLARANRTNSVLTAPAGLANNDILLALLVCGDGGDQVVPAVTPPTGFTQLTGFPISISAADPYATGLRAYWKLAASESGSYTFTHGAADSEGVMYAISGADSTPENPAPTTATGSGGTSTATGLTTPANDCLVVFATMTWDLMGAVTPPTGTTPTFTERYDGTKTLYAADGVLATAGATGNKSVTTANSNQNATTLICIEVAAAAASRQQALSLLGIGT